MKCVDCFNFKTQEVTKRNLPKIKEIFPSVKKISKAVKERKQIKIYYCTYELTPCALYIEHETKQDESSALRIEVKGCKMGDF